MIKDRTVNFLLKHKILIMAYTIVCILLSFLSFCQGCNFKRYKFPDDAFEVHETEDGVRYSSKVFTLRPGKYTLSIYYASVQGGEASIAVDNNVVQSYVLEKTSENIGNISYSFSIDYPTDRGKVDIWSSSEVWVPEMVITSDKPINTDWYFFSIVFFVLPAFLSFLVYCYENEKYGALFVTCVTLITCIPLFLENGIRFSIDIRDHLYRIQGLYYGILDKQFPVIIYPNMSNEHGQIGVLYPSVLLYPAALLRLCGVSIELAHKFMAVIVNLGAVMSVFYCSKKLFTQRWAIVISTLVYAFDPERLYGIYRAGGGCGAGAAAIFFPVAVYGLINIFYFEKKDWQILAIGFAGIMSTHVVSVILILYFAVFFTILNLHRLLDKEILVSLLKAVGLFFTLSLGVLVPFLKFFLSDWGGDKLMWTTYRESLLEFGELGEIPQRWVPNVILIVSVIFCIIIGRKVVTEWVWHIVLITAVTMASVMSFFPWNALYKIKIVDTLMTTIQETHRAYSIVAFCSALLAGVIIENLKWKDIRMAIFSFFVILMMYCMCDATVRYCMLDYLFCDSVSGDINSRPAEDYLPEGTLREWYSSGEGYVSNTEIIQTKEYTKRGTHVTYSYTCSEDGEFVEFPLFYYDGYEAIDQDGNSVAIVKSDRNKIRYNCDVTDELKTIHIRYKVSAWYVLCVLFSAASCIQLILSRVGMLLVLKRLDNSLQ